MTESDSYTDTHSDSEMTDGEYAASYDHEEEYDTGSESAAHDATPVDRYTTITQSSAAQIAADAAYYTTPQYEYAPSRPPMKQSPQVVSPPVPTQQHDTVIPMHSEPVAYSDNVRPVRTSKFTSILQSIMTVCGETCGGVCEICRMVGEALREAVFNSSFYPRKMDMGRSSAVGGRLLLLVLVEVIILTIQLSVLMVVGSDNEIARLVHMSFLKMQSASLLSVPLGVYIYMFGGLTPSSPGAARVYTLYTVCEIARMLGDLVNLIRFSRAFDDYKHIIAAIAPELVPPDAEWDHGVCGRPHAVGIILITACAVGLVCSFSNILSLLIQRGVMESHSVEKSRADLETGGRERNQENVSFRNPDVRLRSHRNKPTQPAREQRQTDVPRQNSMIHPSASSYNENMELMNTVFDSS